MANKNKLSIYLIKDEFAADDTKILKSDVMNSVHFGKADLEELGIAYFSPSQLKRPTGYPPSSGIVLPQRIFSHQMPGRYSSPVLRWLTVKRKPLH